MRNMNTWKNKVQGIVQKCWEVGEGCQRGCIQHATVSAGLYFPVDFVGPGGSLTYPIPGWRKCEVSALRVLKQVYRSVETAQDNNLLRDKLWEGFESRKA